MRSGSFDLEVGASALAAAAHPGQDGRRAAVEDCWRIRADRLFSHRWEWVPHPFEGVTREECTSVRRGIGRPAGTSSIFPRMLFLGVAGGFALRLLCIWTGLCDGNVVADDAYYYFTIARNLAAGAGPTFDGLSPTNGFHPLYQFLLVPVFGLARAIGQDPWLPIRGALSLCALFDVFTALLLAAILRRTGHATGGTIAAWLWSLSPTSVLLTLRGMEGAVSAFSVALVLFLLVANGSPWDRGWRAFRLGLGIGLAFLARTDNGPLLGMSVLGFLAFDLAARRGALPSGRAIAATVSSVGAGAGLVAAPWLAWNLASFGSLVQVSGLAKLHNRAIFGALPDLHGNEALAGWIARLAAPALHLGQYVAGEDLAMPQRTFYVLGLMALALAFAAPFARQAWVSPRSTMERPLLAFAATFVICHQILYGFFLGTYVVWYSTIPLLLVTLVGGGICGGRVTELSSQAARWGWCCALAVLALAANVNFFAHVSHGPRRREMEVGPVLENIQSRFPAVRTIGGFNVGALGYFATTRRRPRVVNLDGLVNNALYAAWRRDEVLAYLQRHVDLIIMDAPATMKGWLRAGEWERLEAAYPRQGQTMLYGPRRITFAPDPEPRLGP